MSRCLACGQVDGEVNIFGSTVAFTNPIFAGCYCDSCVVRAQNRANVQAATAIQERAPTELESLEAFWEPKIRAAKDELRSIELKLEATPSSYCYPPSTHQIRSRAWEALFYQYRHKETQLEELVEQFEAAKEALK